MKWCGPFLFISTALIHLSLRQQACHDGVVLFDDCFCSWNAFDALFSILHGFCTNDCSFAGTRNILRRHVRTFEKGTRINDTNSSYK